MATLPCVSSPVSFCRSCSTVKTTCTVCDDGDPLGTNFSELAFNVPLAFTTWPSDVAVPSKSAEPVIPVSGFTIADCDRSSLLRLILTCPGVSAVSVALIGPAIPSIFMEPPPGSAEDTVTGNLLVKEKSFTVTFRSEEHTAELQSLRH